ncbi:MFS transporter [Variovorax sp. Root411]|uniref:MFS transporter n=1 Tax=Variovorax sp. Root411 TaxID=1736530 RepID=UPI0006F45A06|nr:MFS transporter [Variovorax sp. Root411]KQW64908.1 MFS transporter [Variovorax sp. Root411]
MTPHPALAIPRWIYASVVFAAALGMFAGFAPVFNSTAGIFFSPLTAEFGWGRGEASLSYAMSMLGLALASPIVGRLMDRFGVKRVIGASILLFGISVAGMALQNGQRGPWITLSFIVGVSGAATSVLGYLAILPQWFDRRLGLAVGIAMCGLGLGAIAMPAISHAAISAFGWRAAYVLLGAGSLMLSLPAWLLLKENRAPSSRETTSHFNPSETRAGLSAALRSYRLWAIFSMFVLASAATLSFGPHLPSMLIGKGFTVVEAARSASMVGVGLLIGRLATGVLIDRIHAPYVACGFFLAGALGCYLIRTSETYALLMGSCFLIGLAIGAEGDMIAYLVRSYFDLASFGTLFGIAFSGYAVGAVVGPIAVGVVFDRTSSYEGTLALMPWLLALAGLLALTLGPYRSRPRSIDAGASPSTA